MNMLVAGKGHFVRRYNIHWLSKSLICFTALLSNPYFLLALNKFYLGISMAYYYNSLFSNLIFELMFLFTDMSALDYIKEFCIITRRRKKLYADIFNKHKDPKPNVIPIKVNIQQALKATNAMKIRRIFTFSFESYFNGVSSNSHGQLDPLPMFTS